jgi:RimJ/RimL family protein N-acetyltransferase
MGRGERTGMSSTAGNVFLRDVLESDLAVFYEDQRHPEANRMATFAARDRDAFTAHWTSILGDETVTAKTIVFDGHVAGNVVSFEQYDERLVGYWIGRRFWGRGVATRALAEFLGHVTARPLHARVAEHNVASVRVLQKCGFAIRGREQGADGVMELVLELS